MVLDLQPTDGPAQRPRRRYRGVVAVLVALVLVGGLLLAAYAGLRHVVGFLGSSAASSAAPADYSGQGTGSARVTVADGDSIAAIGRALKQAGVVETVDAFVAAAAADPQSASIQPGTYTLRQHMSSAAAITLMLDPASQHRILVTEGLRASEIYTRIAAATDLTVAQLEAAAADPRALGVPYGAPSVEGYLYPASYDVQPGETAKQLLTSMVNRFKQAAVSDQLDSRAATVGLTPAQVVTAASIVQAEATTDDYAKVARVVFNRLKADSPTDGKLQLDSTVLYALGKRSLTVSTDQSGTGVKSPYNTYLHAGLPPGPIGSPGETAVEAVLHPAAGPWIWFVTTDPQTGETKFTDDYQQFLTFKQEFKRNQAAQASASPSAAR